MMLCQRCGKNPATLHLTRMVGTQRRELHLCLSCAQGAAPPDHKIQLIDIVKNMLAMEQAAPSGQPAIQSTPSGPRCLGCGFTLEDIGRTGRMGCARCYATFREQIEPVLMRVQGRAGRPLQQEGASAPAEDPVIRDLRQRMKEAVEREEYEEAARIRDEIKALEAGGKNP